MKFLKNKWYFAAFDFELNHTLLARRIADVPVVMWRKDDGSIVALHDACPHRFVPLSKGNRIGDEIQCWYHGIRFDGNGACTAIPEQGTIPRSAKVRAYPLVERHAGAWLWVGDPALADESTIPDYYYHQSEDWVELGHGSLFIDGHCQLVVDNLLDLSHIATVHARTVGNDQQTTAEIEYKAEGDTVSVNRWIENQPPPPIWKKAFNNYPKNVDHWQNMHWQPPGYFVLDVGVTPTGRPKEEGISILNSHIIIPSHSRGCYYFWQVARRPEFGGRVLDKNMTEALDSTFHEDQELINLQQKLLDELDIDDTAESYDFPLTVQSDQGAVRSRRIMQRLLEQEAENSKSKAA